MIEIVLVLESSITEVAIDVADLAVEGRVVFVLADIEPEFVGVVMVDILVDNIVVATVPFNMSVSFLLNFAVAIVNEEPSHVVSLMPDILEEVFVSFAIQVGISVSGEV